MLISPLVLVLRALFLTSWAPTVYAQETNATCRPEYVWMENSLGQNPCLVTAWLNVPCTGTGDASQVLALPPGSYYIGPRNPSSPGAPQMADSEFNLTTNGSYPEPIPGGTVVPKWAFLDVIVSFQPLFAQTQGRVLTFTVQRNSTFNVDAAEAVAFQTVILSEQPDITIEGSSTSSSPGPSSSVPTTTTVNASTRSQNSTLGAATQTDSPVERSGSSKNVGAIVGGVFGAVIGVLLVGALVFCIMLRRRKQTRGDQSLGTSQAADVRELPGWVTPSYHVPTLKGETGSVGGLYDPDDPRTYPTTQSSLAGSGTAGYTGLPQVMS
ncbi:hypothetical protein V8D89_007116 [Ganoderma adspersum]